MTGAAPGAVRRRLLPAGLTLAAGVCWFAWSLPGTTSRRQRASAALVDRWSWWSWVWDHVPPPTDPNRLAVVLAAVSLAMFVAWAVVVHALWPAAAAGGGVEPEEGAVTRDRRAARQVVAGAALLTLVGVVALPTQTSDVYDYALFGRVVAVHGGDAYRDVPDDYPDDAVHRIASHQYTGRPDNKLPAWTAVTVAVASVTGDDPVTNLLAFRFLLGAASVTATALIAAIAHRIRPGTAAAAAASFGLNPITLVYGTSKSDSLMVLVAVAAVALVLVDRRVLAVVAATLAVLVKLIAAPVLVLVLVVPGRAGRSAGSEVGGPGVVREVIGRAALAGALVVAAYAPFPEPISLLRSHLSDSARSSAAGGLHDVALVVFVVALVVAAVVVRLHPATEGPGRARLVVMGSAPALLVFALLLTRPGLPWYLLSALAVVALARSAVMSAVLGAVSAASFLMGWWDGIGTRAHPLPDLVPHRAFALVAAVLALGLVVHLTRQLATRGWRPVFGVSDPARSG